MNTKAFGLIISSLLVLFLFTNMTTVDKSLVKETKDKKSTRKPAAIGDNTPKQKVIDAIYDCYTYNSGKSLNINPKYNKDFQFTAKVSCNGEYARNLREALVAIAKLHEKIPGKYFSITREANLEEVSFNREELYEGKADSNDRQLAGINLIGHTNKGSKCTREKRDGEETLYFCDLVFKLPVHQTIEEFIRK